MKLRYVHVPVSDMATAVAFYAGTLGMEEAWREGDGTVAYWTSDRSVQLMLDPCPRPAIRHPGCSVPGYGDPDGNVFCVYDQKDRGLARTAGSSRRSPSSRPGRGVSRGRRTPGTGTAMSPSAMLRPWSPPPKAAAMIDNDLPAPPGSPLVRGLTACLSSVTELPITALPRPADDAALTHAVAALKTWLAGRDFGMVPIAEPRSFQWAGYWIAVVDTEQGQAACVAFGTPPGIVLSPQDRTLLGRATADLPISSAYAVASLNPVVPPVPEAAALTGTVELIAVAPQAEAPMQLVEAVRALPGRGLEGDRYADDAGTFSPRGAQRPGYELTLFAAEVLDDLAAQGVPTDFVSTRRNVLTRDVDVNALVGRDFRIGEVRLRGLRYAEPCVHLDRLNGTPRLRALIHRGGLRADILEGGELRPGLPITTD